MAEVLQNEATGLAKKAASPLETALSKQELAIANLYKMADLLEHKLDSVTQQRPQRDDNDPEATVGVEYAGNSMSVLAIEAKTQQLQQLHAKFFNLLESLEV